MGIAKTGFAMQQVPPQPLPGDTPAPPSPTRAPPPIEDPSEDPTQEPPPVQEPDVGDPNPSPDPPPMIA